MEMSILRPAARPVEEGLDCLKGPAKEELQRSVCKAKELVHMESTTSAPQLGGRRTAVCVLQARVGNKAQVGGVLSNGAGRRKEQSLKNHSAFTLGFARKVSESCPRRLLLLWARKENQERADNRQPVPTALLRKPTLSCS
ncbi:unnamed protein product [Natator depressus]